MANLSAYIARRRKSVCMTSLGRAEFGTIDGNRENLNPQNFSGKEERGHPSVKIWQNEYLNSFLNFCDRAPNNSPGLGADIRTRFSAFAIGLCP